MIKKCWDIKTGELHAYTYSGSYFVYFKSYDYVKKNISKGLSSFVYGTTEKFLKDYRLTNTISLFDDII
jgi:hypothetical protein